MLAGPDLLRAWKVRMKFDSNKQLADYLVLHESTVTKLLKGTREPGLDVALRLERQTGIPVEAWSDATDTLVMAGARPRGKAK